MEIEVNTLTHLLSKMASQKHNGILKIVPHGAKLFFLDGRLLNVEHKNQRGFSALYKLFNDQIKTADWSVVAQAELFLIEEKFNGESTEAIIMKLVNEQKLKKVHSNYLTLKNRMDDNLILL